MQPTCWCRRAKEHSHACQLTVRLLDALIDHQCMTVSPVSYPGRRPNTVLEVYETGFNASGV